jgi:hypothetical protein
MESNQSSLETASICFMYLFGLLGVCIGLASFANVAAVARAPRWGAEANQRRTERKFEAASWSVPIF